MERLGSATPDLLTKTIELAPSEDYCRRHGRVVPKNTMMILGTERTFPGSCPDCATEEAKQSASQERQRRRTEQMAAREKAGVPRRYLEASVESFTAEVPAQRAVLDVVRQFIVDPACFGTGLLLLGGFGTGKSLVASAVINAFLERGRTGGFGTALSILQRIRATWKTGAEMTEEEAFRRFTRPDLLVIDEIGVQQGSDTERIILGEIVNDRYSGLKPTIMCGNVTVGEFTEVIGERVVDRFREGGRVLVFNWPSFRGKR